MRKRINKLIIPFFFLITSCKSQSLIYSLENEYTGVCAVFVVDDLNNKTTNTEFESGMSVISKNDLSRSFIFKEKGKGNEISIIEIGKKVTDNERHIFQLTNNTISARCTTEDIKVITFFIGTQKEFERWETNKIDELTTLEKLNVDWCAFYKHALQ